jgi:hypothetical protein
MVVFLQTGVMFEEVSSIASHVYVQVFVAGGGNCGSGRARMRKEMIDDKKSVS